MADNAYVIDLSYLFPETLTVNGVSASVDVDVDINGSRATVSVDAVEIDDPEWESIEIEIGDEDAAAFVVAYLDQTEGVTLEALEAMIVAIRRVAHEDHRVGPDPDGDGEE